MPADRMGRGLLVVALLAILGLTLFPIGPELSEPLSVCLICGARGTADALVNVLLFLPLGIALGLNISSGLRPYLFAALLSAVVEFTQLFLPGRHTALGDVLFNTTGAAAGVWVVRSAPRWLRPQRARSARLSLAAAALVASLWTATGYLLKPTFPRTTYYGLWTPNLGAYEWYRGRVLDVSLARLPIGHSRLTNSDSVRSLLLGGAPLRVRAVAGPPTNYIAPILGIYDAWEREILLLGPDQDELVLRYRTRAAALRLDQPDLRIVGAFRTIVPGDTIDIRAQRDTKGFSVVLGGSTSRLVGYTLGSAWGLLLYPPEFPAWLRAMLNVGWMATSLIPTGFWVVRRWESLLAGAGLVAALILVPQSTGLLPVPPIELAGLLAGFSVGVALHFAVSSTTRSG